MTCKKRYQRNLLVKWNSSLFMRQKCPRLHQNGPERVGLELSSFLVGGKGGGAFKDTMGGGFEEMKCIVHSNSKIC